MQATCRYQKTQATDIRCWCSTTHSAEPSIDNTPRYAPPFSRHGPLCPFVALCHPSADGLFNKMLWWWWWYCIEFTSIVFPPSCSALPFARLDIACPTPTLFAQPLSSAFRLTSRLRERTTKAPCFAKSVPGRLPSLMLWPLSVCP